MDVSLEARRRRHIIGCTIDVLVRDGVAGTSLSRVAAEAKVAKGIICYYFGSKNGLFDAVLAGIREHMVAAVLEEAGAAEGNWPGVAAFIVGHLAYVRNHRAEMLALRHLASTRAGGSDISDHLAIWREQKAWLIDALTAGQDRGAFKAFDAAVVATAISGALESGLLQWAHDATIDLDLYASQLLDLFGPGICEPPPEAQRASA